MQQNDTQPQFDDVDEFAHVFDSTLPEDEWKIRLPRELGLEARERARHDGITLTELTRRALLSDDSDGCSDAVGIGRMPKNSDGRKQLGDEWKIKLPYAIGKTARERATEEGMSLSSLARRAISGYLRQRDAEEQPLF